MKRWGYFIPCGIGIFLLLSLLRFPDGSIGHDYHHAFVRFLIGANHFWKNGFSLPQYTASLCAGEPFLADPQSTYFSLTQWLVFWMEPWLATLFTVALFALLGYLGFLALLKESLQIRGAVAHFVSLAFLLNGFTYAHLLVGHLTHHGFFLAPWLLWAFFRRKTPIILVSFLWTYLVYSGALHVGVVFIFMVFIAAPLILLVHAERKTLGSFLGRLIGVAFLTFLCTFAKIYAGWSYSSAFISRAVETPALSLFQLLEYYFWFTPSSTPHFLSVGEYDLGAWEFVAFVTKLTIPAILFGLAEFFRAKRGIKAALLWSGGMALVTILIASGKLPNSSIPLLRGYHNPIKILGSLIPIFLLALAWALSCLEKRFPFKIPRPLLFLGASLLLLAEFWQGAKFFRRIPEAGNFAWDSKSYQILKSNFPVVEKVSNNSSDLAGLLAGESSMNCYEPLFGYDQAGWKGEVVLGPTRQIENGHFNLTHPGCLLYPDFFHCARWERIEESDREAFEDLIAGKQPHWPLPWGQLILNWLTAATLLGMGSLPLLGHLNFLKRNRRKMPKR